MSDVSDDNTATVSVSLNDFAPDDRAIVEQAMQITGFSLARLAAALKTNDAWVWVAHYRDGTTFAQIDENGNGHSFAEVTIKEVAAIELVPLRVHLPRHIMLIDVARKQRPIFFRRQLHFVPLDDTQTLDLDAQQHILSATVLGWMRGAGKRKIAHYTAFFEDGSSFGTDDRATLDARLHLIASLKTGASPA